MATTMLKIDSDKYETWLRTNFKYYRECGDPIGYSASSIGKCITKKTMSKQMHFSLVNYYNLPKDAFLLKEEKEEVKEEPKDTKNNLEIEKLLTMLQEQNELLKQQNDVMKGLITALEMLKVTK